ncbi:8-oxo-dGTP diphosphatase [Arthrobacter sp. UYP6]|uniref:NUDIX hydrolase n=1 Tax=Arthrobacter sp. UYP6 TaxID=1756378 RepID=UPI00339619AD
MSAELPRKDSASLVRPGLIAVSYVIFRRGHSVLLQRRGTTGYLDGYWATAAAGHVEAGESAVGCAIRETREELGLTVDTEQLMPLTTLHRSGPGPSDRVDFFFLCTGWTGAPQLQEPEKATDLHWFPLAALPLLVVPHERLVFQGLAQDELTPLLTVGFAPDGGRLDATDSYPDEVSITSRG